MIPVELQHRDDISLIIKALGCLWSHNELNATEKSAFHRCECALDYAADTPHESGEPQWLQSNRSPST